MYRVYKKYYIAVDVGGTNLKFGLFGSDNDSDRKLIAKFSCDTVIEKKDSERKLVNYIHDIIDKILADNLYGLNQKRLVGIGYAIPGPVIDNKVLLAVNINWKKKFDIVRATKNRFGSKVRVSVLNDANAATLGEYKYGLKGKYKSLCLLTLGTAVGGGIIIDGKLIEGKNGIAGEFGHIRVDFSKDAIKCNCGKRGCLERVASGRGIAEIYNKMYHTNVMKNAQDVIEKAKKFDKKALKSLNISLEFLSMVISVIIHSIDPEIILIGGGVSNAGKFIIDIIKKNLKEKIRITNENTNIMIAKLKNDAGLYGAVAKI